MMTTKSVNRPTNVKQKEADINQKLQLYGIFTAFSNGKVPSNKQIDVALNSFLASRALSSPSAKLSPEGRKLVADFRDVVEQAKYMLLTKNAGNLLQDFIWQTEQMSGAGTQLPGAPIDKNTARQHGNQALDGLRTLGTLVLSNGQFRKLLSDATVLLRDIAGDAAQNAANRVNPSKDELSQIDRPADDNTWHDVPSRGDLKSQMRGQVDKQKPFSRSEMRDAVGDASQSASGSRDPGHAADMAGRDQRYGTDHGVDAQSGARAGMQNLQDRASQNMPDETKDRARQTAGQAKGYLQDKFPEERRQQTIHRLKKMIVEIQGHQDYQQAIETLLNIAENYAGHAQNLTQQAAGSVKGAHSDTALTQAENDLRTLLERFANHTSADDLMESINDVYRDADRDPELKSWFQHMNRYVRKCLKEQGYIMTDGATQEWNQLSDRGQFLLRDRYRDHTNRIFDEAKFFGEQFDKDPMNKRFANSMQKLFNELGNDENGKPTFKPHLIKDLTDVILPGLFESIRYVPIPRIEYSDPMMDAVVENLVIESDNLMPNVFEFGSDNYLRWGRKTVASKIKNKVMVSVSGVQMDLKDVSYYIKKKQGFPSITDTGLMDIFMGGTGFSFKIAMETADKSDRQHFFKIDKVTVDVKNLNIKLKKSKFKLLFGLFKPLLFGVIRPAITKLLEKMIKDYVHQADGYAYDLYREVERAGKEAQKNPEQAQNIYQRYVNAAQKKALQGKQKTQEAAADKKVNVALTQHDSIFPNVKLPGGISTKATEYKDLARKGDKWESPIFGIGSARETSDLPKPTPISRKPHHTASGGVRGNQNMDSSHSNTGIGSATSTGYDQGYGQGTGAGYGQSTGASYGQSTGASYGQSTGASYGQPTGAGYGQPTGAGYGQTNGSAGFSSQVNQAFGNDGQDLSLKNNTGVNGPVPVTTGGTLLGANNPVLSGIA